MCFWLVLKYFDLSYAYFWVWKCPRAPEGRDITVQLFGFQPCSTLLCFMVASHLCCLFHVTKTTVGGAKELSHKWSCFTLCVFKCHERQDAVLWPFFPQFPEVCDMLWSRKHRETVQQAWINTELTLKAHYYCTTEHTVKMLRKIVDWKCYYQILKISFPACCV